MRNSRRIDSVGLRNLRANEWRIADRRRRASEATSPHNGGEAAPLTLIGGFLGNSIGKMDAGERKSSIGIDWLQGTVPFERMDMLFDWMSGICGCQPEFYSYGGLNYQRKATFHPFGINIFWDLDEHNRKRHNHRICLQVTGSGLAGFTPANLLRFMYELSRDHFFKCSRIDLAFDDFEKIISPLEVFEFAEQESYQHFSVHGIEGKRKRNGESKGFTCCFGNRGKNGGGKYLRCYNKEKESKGEINSIRWEVEFSKDKANAIFFKLAMSNDIQEFADKIAAYIGGSIDFIERSDSGRCNPIDRLAFWEQILDHLGCSVLRCPRPPGDIDTSIEWMEKSVMPCAEKIRQAIGDDAFQEWLFGKMGDVKLTKRAAAQVYCYHFVNGEPVVEEAPF